MKTYRIETIENNYLETITFHIMETELINGKRFTESIYSYDNLPQTQSKLNLLNLLK